MSIKTEVKPGIIQINLDERRYYKVGDSYLPSITTILDAYPKDRAFYQYLSNLPDWEYGQQRLRDAGDQGSRVHWAVETLLNGETVNYSDVPYGYSESFTPKEWKFILAFMNWFENHKPQVISIEETVVEPDVWAGTADLVCKIENQTVIVDWKTGGAIYESHKCQAAGYATALGLKEARIVRLGSRHKVGYEQLILNEDDILKYYNIFLHVLGIWSHENPNPHPRFLEVPETLTLLDLYGGPKNA